VNWEDFGRQYSALFVMMKLGEDKVPQFKKNEQYIGVCEEKEFRSAFKMPARDWK
jgi:hypothetical protein